MFSPILGVHEGLGAAGRLRAIARGGERISAAELALLCLLGISAALLSAFVRLRLGISGHNIIRVIFPMALGLAMVPRRGAATVMAASGTAAAGILMLFGTRGIGAGAVTSLALTGLLLDVALLGARSGGSVYVRLTLAGTAANLLAFLMRGGAKLFLAGHLEGIPWALWWPKALITYPICGALAGLISAAVWFRRAADRPPRSSDGDAA
jgi:hypothetical protein